MKTYVALLSIVAICGATALADLPTIGSASPKGQLRTATGEFIPVLRVARVTADGVRGPWIDMQSTGGISQGCGGEMIYDCAELDTADPTQWTQGCGIYGNTCNACVANPSTRWFFGVNACFGLLADDMTVKPGWEGLQADRVSFFWSWNPEANGGPIGGESCIIVVFTTEDASVDCIAPATGGTFSGIVYNFGVLGDGNGYRWTDTGEGLCNAGLFHDLPVDGVGGTLILPTTRFVDLQDYDMATCSQSMLWGTQDPGANLPGTAPWSQQGEQWVDGLAAKDGVLTEDECTIRSWAGFCPDPMGNTIAFAGGGVDPCAQYLCGDCNCDGLFNGSDIDPFFLALGDPAAWQTQYPLCDRVCVADITGDGRVQGDDIDAFFVALGVGHCP